MKRTLVLSTVFAVSLCAAAQPGVPALHSTWVTLGTNTGPGPRPERSEPAHLLLYGDQKILVDCGDGAGVQLAKAGISLRDINAIVISHLHFDHTGGLFGILGPRFQLQSPTPLTIYGPPGTQRTVEGLLAAMLPEAESGWGMPGAALRKPGDLVHVVEVTDGDHFTLGPIKVSARRNTHYSYKPGSEEEKRFVSLAYRFDLPDRSLAFTGDTGPSKNVEELAQGVDILFSEVMDPVAVIASLRVRYPDLPPAAMKVLSQHMIEQHLSPETLGTLAKAANVKEVVMVHNEFTAPAAAKAIQIIHQTFPGKVIEAQDLDRF